MGTQIPIFRRISKLCGVPDGAESLLLLGLLGGYPVGAQMVAQAYHRGQLDKPTAQRMLGFCNNAGPAFLFGMVSPMFSHNKIAFVLWGIHVLSALITGILLPGRQHSVGGIQTAKPISVSESLEKSLKIIAQICGWVILFKVLLTICEHWVFNYFPSVIRVLLTGLCELSNGCTELKMIDNEATRYIISSFILAAGGLCVAMQTASVTKELGMGMFFPGKLIQAGISTLFACCTAPILFPGDRMRITLPFLLCSIALILSGCIFFLLFRKKGGNLQRNDV